MFRRVRLYTVLVAWLLATGAQWDVLQVFAWGRMVAIYSQNMPVLQAVKLTFQRDGMCDVCRFVEAAKEREAQQSGALPGETKRDTKPALFPPPAESLRLFVAGDRFAPPVNATVPPAWRAAPPVPPPRAA